MAQALAAGLDPDMQLSGEPLLILAVERGHDEVVSLLLSAKADPMSTGMCTSSAPVGCE